MGKGAVEFLTANKRELLTQMDTGNRQSFNEVKAFLASALARSVD